MRTSPWTPRRNHPWRRCGSGRRRAVNRPTPRGGLSRAHRLRMDAAICPRSTRRRTRVDRRMELPLFPMNTVLCPGIALPLHIFEDRYRALVRQCIDSSSPFGVVMIREGREVGTGAISFTGIGTIAEIRDAGRYEDGRYDLLIVGTRRFEIQRVLAAKQP